jgi:signal transduction histidine kinase
LLAAILDAANALAESSKAALQLVDSATQCLYMAAHCGFPPVFGQLFHKVEAGQTPCGDAMYLKKRILIRNFYKTRYFRNMPLNSQQLVIQAKICSSQSTPIFARNGKVLGILNTHWEYPHTPDDNILLIMDLLSRMAADLIEHLNWEENLRLAKEKAEKVSYEKDIFLASLSHELRTPLTALLCWTQILKRNPNLTQNKINFGLQSIEDNAIIQNKIIDDLLDVSSIVMGKITIHFENIAISTILNKAINSLRSTAEQKNILLEVNLEVDNITVYADATRLQQIFVNIISNAIKFTKNNGKIAIKLFVINNYEEKHVQIIVADNGIGIKKELLPYIFDRFNQADIKHSKLYGGLGLGLTIAKSLLTLQQGTITVESAGDNHGATFTITLPILNYE